MRSSPKGRRSFLARAAVLLGGVAVAQIYRAGGAGAAGNGGERDVTPTEDLMREHGVLDRLLLVYEEILWRRLLQQQEFPPEVLSRSADIVRRFIEDYHEKLEEDFIFPRFERAGKLASLVGVLRTQHQAGRRLTDTIRARATLAAIKDPAERMRLREPLRLFVRMYRPHAAWEDTVLFPAVRSVVSAHEFAALGEEFERKEHQLFGSDGYERIVAEIAGLEAALGIEDLARFTPDVRA